ncbi:MAG: beta-ketoacyl-ACP synthase II [Firmicutes bacterium]|jgi:3-oxoacyl-[acyl-carrier-protein] synthase II|nr:beta-ketoacyl-ACP synthase II [Bacillota bacterium]
MERRVVVTGMGCVTPVGNNLNDFWESILNGKIGIDKIKNFDTSNHKVSLGAEIKDLDLSPLGRKLPKRTDKVSQLALLSAIEAMEDSNINLEEVDPYSIGVSIGNAVGGMESLFKEYDNLNNSGENYVSPITIPKFLSNIISGNISMYFKTKGPSHTFNTACSSSTDAIGHGYRLIKDGYVDTVIAGGSESCINPLMISAFNNLGALSNTEDPSRASIPFDKKRNGFVLGEGAGILILESLESALERDAKIYGEIIGYGSTCDAYHLTSPDPSGQGMKKAIEMALKDSNVSKDSIKYINAHGTSTQYNDITEHNIISSYFEDQSKDLYINSTKSMIGHTQGAAGAIEAITCLKSLKESYIHQTIGSKETEEDMNLNYCFDRGYNIDIDYAMSLSLGFGGHNGCLVFRKYRL